MLGLSPIGDWSITSCRGVDSFSSKLGMKKVARVLRICLGKKWEGVGIEILGTKNLAVDKDNKTLKRF